MILQYLSILLLGIIVFYMGKFIRKQSREDYEQPLRIVAFIITILFLLWGLYNFLTGISGLNFLLTRTNSFITITILLLFGISNIKDKYLIVYGLFMLLNLLI